MAKQTVRIGALARSTPLSAMLSTLLLALLPVHAHSGAIQDADGDLVPDQFDNCSLVANGPNQTTNQVDSDLDGYGNRCDADLDQNCATTAADFGLFLGVFGTNTQGEVDFDGNGTITAADFGVFLGKFSATGAANAPGPSGLVCAACNGVQPPCTP
jgi:hypothetical protein